MRRVMLILVFAVFVASVVVEGCSATRKDYVDAVMTEKVAKAAKKEKVEPKEVATEADARIGRKSKPEPTEADARIEPKSKPEPESEPEPEPEPQVFVLIDLSEQRLSVIKAVDVSADADGEVLFGTGIVSGTANTSRATPTGTYSVYSKVPGKYLKPRGGSKVWVDYWMPFNGGIGMHDATWRNINQFGTDQYKWSGSHGCINLPHEAAATIYDLIEVGTTVIVVE